MSADARENTYDVNSDTLAESERLREKADAAILAMSSSLDLAVEKAEKFRNARDEAEAKVVALTALMAQSSTQYREMVRALDTIANKPIGDAEASDREVLDAIVQIARDAIANADRSTP